MREIIINVIIRRTAELLILSICISGLITGLYVLELFESTQKACVISSCIGMAVYIIINVSMLRTCYFELGNKPVYYGANYTAYFIFMLISAGVYILGGDGVYTWGFVITKAAKYWSVSMDTKTAAVIFHCIMGAVIALAPAGMKRVLKV